MKSRGQHFLLGLVTLGFLALFVGSILFLYPRIQYTTQTIVVHFRHDEGVAPLKIGSPVLLSAAMEVGKVTGIYRENVNVGTTAAPKYELHIVVEAAIERDLALWDGVKITTDQPPVGGAGYVVILDVGTAGRPLPKRPILGLPPQSFGAAIGALSRRILQPDGLLDDLERTLDPAAEGQLMNRVLSSAQDLNAITKSLRTQLDPLEQAALMHKLLAMVDDLGQTLAAIRQQTATADSASLLAKVHVAIDKLSESLAEVAGLVHENRPAVTEALGNVSGLARTLNEDILVRLRRDVDRDDPQSMLGKLHAAMDSINASLSNVEAISDTGRQVLALNRPGIDRTLANVKEMSEQLRLASEELRLAPWRLLYKPTPAESREMGVFDAARTFAEAATYLDDAAARLEAAVTAAPHDGKSLDADPQIREIRESLRAAFDRFQLAEKYLFNQLK
ncbi:MAG: hypothetical protein U1D55_18990 [Phycisphaerae bacterium]